jgi:hypothetical protein
MDELIIPRKLTRMVKGTMEDTLSYVRVQTFPSDPLDGMNGLRKAVVLACPFPHIVSRKVIKDSHIQTSGQIFTKSIQLIGHAGDVAFIARTRRDLVEGVFSLGDAAEGTGLGVNQT